MIDIERDSAGWNLDADEVQRRRILFWEIYTCESWSVSVTMWYANGPCLHLSAECCAWPSAGSEYSAY